MDQEQLLGTNYISHRKYNEIFKLYNLHLYVILAIGILRFFFPVVIVFFNSEFGTKPPKHTITH